VGGAHRGVGVKVERPRLCVAAQPGWAVQVDPVKLTLKVPGTQRLKLKNYRLLSVFAFILNLHRYNQGVAHADLRMSVLVQPVVGQCGLTLSNRR